jgi:zinc/manganese transport system substrate-binding protein
MKKLLLAFFALSLFIPGLTHAAEPPLRIVASFSILGDMVKQIGGDAVDVRVLVPVNGDAHTYQPTPDDAKALAAANIIAINGLGLESWMDRIIEASGTKAKLLVASAGVKPRILTKTSTGKEVADPHAWQDLRNGRLYIRNIASALMAAKPDEAKKIRERAIAYDNALVKMDDYVKQQFADIPAAQRKIVTSHDAFGYFGAAYDVTFLAPVGMSTEDEPSAANVAGLIEQIKAEGVKQVFIENMTDPRLIAQIAKDSGAKMGGTLFSDALSPPDGPAPTYLDMFRNNVPKLREAMLQNGR